MSLKADGVSGFGIGKLFDPPEAELGGVKQNPKPLVDYRNDMPSMLKPHG